MVQVPPPPSPTSQERLLGTLIVIVLRAKNLPNRVRIGKQNPYCTITYGLHKKRTDTIERGGQQPEWDAEFRFEILKEGLGGEEQLAAEAAIVTHKGGVLPAPAPAMAPSTSQGSDVSATGVKVEKRLSKHSLGTPVVSTCASGKRVLKVACWADDARDPKLIGEGELDIEETIRKGKYDDWVQLERKGRYAGEVYLELTWYSNEPRPPQRNRRGSNSSPVPGGGTAYGGAGSRVEDRSGSDTGTEEWDAAAPTAAAKAPTASSTAGSASQSRPFVPVPTELAADYPDPDVAPLTTSISTMSLSRPPLPVPPVSHPPPSAASAASFAPYPYETHATPAPLLYGGQDPTNDVRRASQSSYGLASYPTPGPQQQYHHGGYTPAQPPPPAPSSNEFGQYPPIPPHEQLDQYSGPTYPASALPAAPSSYAPQSTSPWPDAHYPTFSNPSPYPLPPVPPIPPTGSPYWQQQQHQSSAVYAGSPSHGPLPPSSSQATLYPGPPPPPLPSFHYGHTPLPPPPSLGHSQQHHTQLPPPPVPPQPPAFQHHAPPVFSPPPPPPSLRTDNPAYAPAPAPASQHPYHPNAYDAASQSYQSGGYGQTYGQEQPGSGQGRPPLPQPPASIPPSSSSPHGGSYYSQQQQAVYGQPHGYV
ncbi:hypothetical protein JCM3774_002030 [Rhodotorula dairenensis]